MGAILISEDMPIFASAGRPDARNGGLGVMGGSGVAMKKGRR
jgi:hypothetical protein